MRKLLVAFVILLIAVGIGFLVQRDSGYLLIAYDDWRIETSVWIGLLVLVIVFLLGYGLLKLRRHASQLSGSWRQRRATRQQRHATHLGCIGFMEMAEGQWQAAEQHFVAATTHSHCPWINFLQAAKAAQEQDQYEQRDYYIRCAQQSYPKGKIAIGITHAKLQMQAQQWHLAAETLEKLHKIAPTHPMVLRLLQQATFELMDWERLIQVVALLRKYKVMNKPPLDSLEHKAYESLMHQAPEDHWQRLPAALKHETNILLIYVDYLIKQQQFSKASTLIEQELKINWRPSLLTRFAEIPSAKGVNQLATAERWLYKHPRDPDLLFCLGQLSAHERFWRKAKDYLQQAIQLHSSQQAHLALAQVLEALGEKDAALAQYRQAMPRI